MDAYCVKIRKLEGKLYGIIFHHVIRDVNQAVDHLSKIWSTKAHVLSICSRPHDAIYQGGVGG
jgi:hypothetical protein